MGRHCMGCHTAHLPHAFPPTPLATPGWGEGWRGRSTPPGAESPPPLGGDPPPRGNCNWQPVSVCSGGGHASRNKGGEEGNLNHHSPPPDSDRGGLLLKMFSWPHGPQQATAKRGYVTSVQTKKANQGLTRPEETQARRENSKDAAARAPPRTALRIARCLYSCVGYVLALFC